MKKLTRYCKNCGRENLGNGCEYDFGLQIGIAGYKMFFLNKYLAKYRVAPNSMSSSKTGDSGYQSFRILKNLSLDTSLAKEIRSLRLYERAPIAITQAVNIGKRREAFQIFTGKWYRRRILTLKGIKRALYILFAPSYKKT
ncbi:hypothetical protein LCGC14_2734100 [marine sediment metagenome]|uniref:Uncharacterized protein n=1 Tax=marine sediment metagenome TaxID=412755 RepID=A0A0F8Z6G2_9ZZZZ